MENLEINENKSKNKLLLHYGLFVLTIIALFFASEIARVTTPIFSRIYYGNLVDFFVNIVRGVFYILIFIFGTMYSKKHFRFENKISNSKNIPIKRIAILYVIVLAACILISAVIDFKVKIVYDLGSNITGSVLMTNISEIILGIIRMALVMLIIKHSQEFFEILINKKFAKHIPFGGLVALVGIGLFVLSSAPIEALDILLLVMYIVYGEMYLLSYKLYGPAYVCSMLIQLL